MNVASYKNPFNNSLSGQQVKDWIWYHAHANSSYTKKALLAVSLMNKLEDNKFYILKQCNGRVIVKEVPEKGKKYEVPCNN